MNHKTLYIALGLAALLSSCSVFEKNTPNQLRQHQAPTAWAAETLQPDGRYRNLFTSPQRWPHSCETDCYSADPRVLCKEPASQCKVRWPAASPLFNAQLQWLGHASFRLLTPAGQLLIFDPVSADFDWPINWLAALVGSRRTSPQFAPLADGQPAAAVLYSHAHYDHFHQADAVRLGQQSPLYLPAGMARYLPPAGLQLHEMAWYSQHQLGELRLHFVPAHHYSGRGLYELDGDTSLWGGWVLQLAGKQIYVAGDTGYSPVFQQIRARYGAMTLCLLPIGSYDGEHYRNAHLTPEDALQVAQELGCQRMIPWGYGNHSWLMGDKSSHSALLRLLSMHRQLQSPVELLVLNEGDIVQI